MVSVGRTCEVDTNLTAHSILRRPETSVKKYVQRKVSIEVRYIEMALFRNYRRSISIDDLHFVTIRIIDRLKDQYISDMYLQILGLTYLLAKKGGVLLTLRGQILAQVLAIRT